MSCLWALVALVATLVVAKNTQEGTAPLFKQSENVLFVKQSTVHTSKHAWTISFEVDMSSYELAARQLINSIEDFMGNLEEVFQIIYPNQIMINATKQLLHKEYLAINNIKVDARFLLGTVENLKAICKSTCQPDDRKRRSVLPFVGDIMSILFGTAVSSKTDDIRRELRQLEASSQNVRNIVGKSMTVLDKTTAVVVENRQLLQHVSDVVRAMVHSYNETLQVVEDFILPMQQAIFRSLQQGAARQTFSYAYFKLAAEVHHLETSVSDLIAGVVTPDFFFPSMLGRVLRKIKYVLPPGLALPYSLDESTYHFYRIMQAHVNESDHGFLVTLVLPLYDDTSSFSIYSITHLPMTLALPGNVFVNHTAVYKTDHDFVAISKDNTKIMFLEAHTVEHCLSTRLTFCFINNPVLSSALLLKYDCITRLFYNQPHNADFCESRVSPMPRNHVIATYITFNMYAISTANPTTFTLVCEDSSRVIKISPPIQILQLPLGCRAQSPLMSLENQLPGHSDITLPSFELHLPKLNEIWTPVLDTINRSSLLNVPEKIPDVILEVPRIPDVHAMASALAPYVKHGLPWYYIFSMVFTTVSLLSGICYLGFRYRKALLHMFNRCKGQTRATPKVTFDTRTETVALRTEPLPTTSRSEKAPEADLDLPAYLERSNTKSKSMRI